MANYSKFSALYFVNGSQTPSISAEILNQLQHAILNIGADLGRITTPDGFLWTTHPLVGLLYYDRGRIRCDYDVRSNRPIGIQGYLAPASAGGSDANDGLTAATPKLTITSLLAASADIKIVNYAPGLYRRQSITSGRNLSFVGSQIGKTVWTSSDDLSWSLSGGRTYTYQASRTNVLRVVDFRYETGEDEYKFYTLVASVDEVEATEGTWYTDGSIVYVHPIGGGAPSNDIIRALLNADAFSFKADTESSLFFENILSMGGASTAASIAIGSLTAAEVYHSIYMYNIRAKYAGASGAAKGNGFQIENGLAIMQKCKASHNSADGFNYHIANSGELNVVELDCEGFYNGYGGIGDNDNGSSIHDGGTIIRVNGYYHHNKGPNVTEVSDGTYSWNLGVSAYITEGVTNPDLDYDFQFNAGDVHVWLDSCRSWGSTGGLYLGDDTTDVVSGYVRNCMFEIDPEIGNLSELTEY